MKAHYWGGPWDGWETDDGQQPDGLGPEGFGPQRIWLAAAAAEYGFASNPDCYPNPDSHLYPWVGEYNSLPPWPPLGSYVLEPFAPDRSYRWVHGGRRAFEEPPA
jgi:hypothetical protein